MNRSVSENQELQIGVVTVSDRAYAGEYQDRSGPAIVGYLQATIATPIKIHSRLVNDEREKIEAALIELADQWRCGLILTTGGTGPAPRDVTPEATEAVCERMMPGFGEQMRRVSVQTVPTAILSRQTAGIRGASFVLNLPGSPKAISECLDAIFPAVPDCLEHVGGHRIDIHREKFKVYRPHD